MCGALNKRRHPNLVRAYDEHVKSDVEYLQFKIIGSVLSRVRCIRH